MDASAGRHRIVLVARAPRMPLNGADIRVVRMLSALASRHDVAAVFLSSDGAWKGPPLPCPHTVCAAPRPGSLGRAKSLFGRAVAVVRDAPCAMTYAFDAACGRAVCERVHAFRPDAIAVESTFLAPCLRDLRQAFPRLPIILDCFDLECLRCAQDWRDLHPFSAKLRGLVEIVDTLRWERRAFRSADLTWMVSRHEQSLARLMARRARFELAPNGGDFSEDAPAPDGEIAGRVVFVGNLRYRPNDKGVHWFLRAIWPRIRAAAPAATLEIVGRDPEPGVRAFDGRDGVRIVGTVESVQPHLAAAQVFVVPLLTGAGTRLKIIEALAARKAVVSTRLGCRGLDLEPGRHLLVADSPAVFAAEVCRLLADPVLRAALASEGRDRARRLYAWDRTFEKVLHVLDTLLTGPRAAGTGGLGEES